MQDLTALADLPHLRNLCLHETLEPNNLWQLTQITQLFLDGTAPPRPDESGVGDLESLTQLQRLKFGGEQVFEMLADLKQLTRIDVNGCSGRSLHELEQLPALATLAIKFGYDQGFVPGQLLLTRLNTLSLTFNQLSKPHLSFPLQLTPMVQLKRLALSGMDGGHAVTAPTVTCLQFRLLTTGVRYLPGMGECTSLALLQLEFSHCMSNPTPPCALLLLDPNRLPPQALQIEACITPPARIFSPHDHGPPFQLRYVSQIASLLEG